MLKASFYCLGHVILLTRNVLELHAHMVATGHWLDGRSVMLLILIVANALLCCVWAAYGVSIWRQRRAERLLDRQVQQAIEEGMRVGRVYKHLLGNPDQAHKSTRTNDESTNNPEEE